MTLKVLPVGQGAQGFFKTVMGHASRQNVIKAGLYIGGIGLLVLIGFLFLLPAFPPRENKRGRLPTANNLKMIGLAFHNYHDVNGSFPLAAIYNKEGQPLLSWRVALLPYLEEQGLYSQFNLDEPWDGPNNEPLLARLPQVYTPPNGRSPQEHYGTYYQVFVGPGAAFENKIPMKFGSFTDGTSHTILAIEASDPVPWTKPEDLPFGPNQPLPRLGGLSEDGTTFCLYVDGSVRYIPKGTDERIIRALITRSGGEQIDFDKLGF